MTEPLIYAFSCSPVWELPGGLHQAKTISKVTPGESFFQQVFLQQVLFHAFDVKSFFFFQDRGPLLEMNPKTSIEQKLCGIAKKSAQIIQINCSPLLFRIMESCGNKRHRSLAGLQNALGCLAVHLRKTEQAFVFLEILRTEGLESMPGNNLLQDLLSGDLKALFNVIHEFAHQD